MAHQDLSHLEGEELRLAACNKLVDEEAKAAAMEFSPDITAMLPLFDGLIAEAVDFCKALARMSEQWPALARLDRLPAAQRGHAPGRLPCRFLSCGTGGAETGPGGTAASACAM